VSSHVVEKRVKWRKSQLNAPCAREKSRADWKKGLANLWSSKKITKKAHAGRKQETKWEMLVDRSFSSY
jgi:hypothetical protein